MANQLSVLNVNDQDIECVLDGTVFSISLTWNETASAFFIGLKNSADEVILAGVKAVVNYPLLYQYREAFMPLGELIIATAGGIARLDRQSFVKDQARLIYVPESELEELGVLEAYGKI